MFSAIIGFLTLFNELFPIVHSAVQLVEQAAPEKTTGAQKFDAAMVAVGAAISAAPPVVAGVTHDLATAKTAAQTGDTAALMASVGHMIELSVSVCKTFGLFQKAGIVQAAPSLIPPPVIGADQPGG